MPLGGIGTAKCEGNSGGGGLGLVVPGWPAQGLMQFPEAVRVPRTVEALCEWPRGFPASGPGGYKSSSGRAVRRLILLAALDVEPLREFPFKLCQMGRGS